MSDAPSTRTLFSKVHATLRSLAERHLRRERAGPTLGAWLRRMLKHGPD